MNKKQKKMLARIIIAAVLLIALHFVPITGIPRLIPDSFLLFIKQLRSYPVRIPESLLYPGTY